ncbi:MAG: 1-acyl-sn-glycerol-3-phosphate acyltransferase [Oscillospiraceae bacterium]|nr:1-acyl-sn-glycerol-3-phosphate acyltransferase [Oscillospiraceae bacterium]
MKKKRTRRNRTVKTPNGALYLIVYLLFYPLLKLFFRLEVDRSEYHPPKGPFLILANHLAYMDFVLVMLAVYPHRLNAVTARKYFFYPTLHRLLPFMGCIPKTQFAPDVQAVKGILEVIRRGNRVLIFPEGRSSTDGAYMGVLKATGKLVKKLEVPVVSCQLDGAYTCMPYWRRGIRLGRLRVTLSNLFDPEDTQRLTVDELNDQINARLSGADSRIPEKPLTLFRARRLAEGLHNVLYFCTVCKREFTLETEGNIIHCTACGNAAEMDRTAKLNPLPGSAVPETIDKWHRAQIAHEMQAIHENMAPIKIPVHVRMPAAPGKEMKQCGQGTLWLDATGWRYEGMLHGETVNLFFPIETVPVISYDAAGHLQICASSNFYMFAPEGGPRTVVKYALIGECLYWRYAPLVQITEGYFGM